MTVKSFTVGGIQYNAAMAAAVDQDRLLSLLGNGLIQRGYVAASQGATLDDSVIVPMLMAMDHQAKVQVADILMGKVHTAVGAGGGSVQVSVRDFGGRMVQYNQLLAELLRWNLGDFFDWLPGALGGAEDPAANPEAL